MGYRHSRTRTAAAVTNRWTQSRCHGAQARGDVRQHKMNQFSLVSAPLRPPPTSPLQTQPAAAAVRARLSSHEPTPRHQQAARLAAVAPQESIEAAVSATDENKSRQEPMADDGTMRALPTCALIGGIMAGVGVALALSAEGPLVEKFWDNMRRYALYALTVSTGVAYTVLEPIVELLKNPVTALLIVVVIAGSGFLVSQVLNAMVGNSEFIGSRKQQTCGAERLRAGG